MDKLHCNSNDDKNNTDYLKFLIRCIGKNQKQICLLLGLKQRTLTRYLSGQSKIPYTVQFCLESINNELVKRLIDSKKYRG